MSDPTLAADTPGLSPRDDRALPLGLLLVLLVLAAYLPALSAAFIWDDDQYVELNTDLYSTPAGLRRIWLEPSATPQYYPLVFTSFWLEYHGWKLSPGGYHAVNLLVHAATSVLLWRVLRRLGVPGAWLAAAVFSLHPVQVESVAWVTERKNTLSAFFYVAALACYLRFSDEGRWRWYGGALALFVAALLSKTIACSLPAAVLVILWWKRGRLTWNDVRPLLPFFVIGAGLGLTTAWLEKHHVGASGEDWSLTPAGRVLVAGRAVWFYAAKLIWPVPLLFIYPKWQVDPRAAWQYAFPLAAVGVIVVLWLARTRLGRGPLAAILLFAGTLFPALGFFDVYPFRYSYVADHFQYLASMAMIALLVGSAVYWTAGRLPLRVARAAALLLLAALGALTWHRTLAFHDRQTLWQDTLAKDPDCWMAHLNLGQEIQKRWARERRPTDLESARAHYERGLALHPREPRGHYNLATVLAAQGRSDEALAHFREAAALLPDFAQAHRDIGRLLVHLRRDYATAVHELEQAAALAPDDPDAWYYLGIALVELERYPDAARAFRKAKETAWVAGDGDVIRESEEQLKRIQHYAPSAGHP